MPRHQFTLRALLVLMFGAACFFGGIRFERDRRRLAEEAAASAAKRSTIQRDIPEKTRLPLPPPQAPVQSACLPISPQGRCRHLYPSRRSWIMPP